MATYTIGDGSGGTLTIFCAALAPIVPASTPTDGTNVMTRLFDLDSGVGSEYNMGFSLRLSASGGSVEGGTATNPVRVDPTGTTPQPISGTVSISGGVSISGTVTVAGTVAATQSGTWTVQQGGAWTVAATQSGAWTVAATQSGAWTVAATQSGVWSVTQSGVWTVTQSGTWTVATNADATIGGTSAPAKLLLVGGKTSDGTPQYQPLPLAAAGASVIISGTVTANQGGAPWSVNLTQIAGAGLTLGQAAMASSIPVVIASNQSAVPVSQSGTWNIATVSAVTSITNPVAVTVADGADVTLGAQADSAAASDTATASLMGLVKRLLQRVTTFIAQLPTALTDAGNFKVAIKESSVPLAVSASGVFTVQTSAAAPLLIAGSDYALRAPAVRAWKVDPLGIGQVALAAPLPAGTNAIGSVTLGAGTAAIGSVTVSAGTLAQLPAALSARGNLQVALAESTVPVSVTAAAPLTVQTAASNPLLLAGSDYAVRTPAVRALKVDALGTAQVNVVSLAGITPSFGKGVSDTGTARVVLASDQATLKVDGSAVTQPVTGAMTITNAAPVPTSQAGPVTVLTGVNAPLVIGGSDYAWRAPAVRPLKVDALGIAQVNVTNATLTVNSDATPSAIASWDSSTPAGTLLALNCANYATVSVSFYSAAPVSLTTGTVAAEATDDSGQWFSVTGASGLGAALSTIDFSGFNGLNTIYQFPVAGYKAFRLRLTSAPTGTGASLPVRFTLRASAAPSSNILAVQAGTWVAPSGQTIVVGPAGSGSPAVGKPVRVAASYNATQPTVADGSVVDLQATARGAIIIATGAETPVVQVSNVLSVGGSTPGAAQLINPVGIAGVFNTTQPTYTTGQVAQGQSTARGGIIVATGVDTFTVDTELPAAAALGDGKSATPTTPTVGVIPLLYNGTTVDLQRANWQEVLLAAGVHSTNFSSGSKTNYNARGCIVSVNVTVAGTSTLTLSIAGLNASSANILLAAAQVITGTGMWAIELGPGCSGATNADMRARTAGQLTRMFSVALSHGDASNWTYSISIDYIL